MNLDTEVEALYRVVMAEPVHRSVSQKSLMALNSLLSSGLVDNSREMRLAVVQILMGRAVWKLHGIQRIWTTKNLSQAMVTTLINELKVDQKDIWQVSEHGQELLSLAESKAQSELIPQT